MPDPEPVRTIAVRAARKQKVKQVVVFGHRDPRGPDNNITIWVDKDDKLHIRVLKAERCYRFEKVIETGSYVEVVQG
jgi:hypothetical protein